MGHEYFHSFRNSRVPATARLSLRFLILARCALAALVVLVALHTFTYLFQKRIQCIKIQVVGRAGAGRSPGRAVCRTRATLAQHQPLGCRM